MDFDDTPAQASFREASRQFLEAHWPPRPPGAPRIPLVDIDDPETVRAAKAWQATKFEAGWACLEWPAEYGGKDAGAVEALIFEEEEREFDTPAVNLFMIGHGMLGPTIIAHGTEEQKLRYLRPMARGDTIWCQLFSEPSGGSDIASVRTTSRRDGNGWVINGQKIWTSAAHIGDFAVCVTRSDPDTAKHRGLTCFIVDLKAPGVEIRRIRQMDGKADFNEVFLDDLRLGDDMRLGGEGEGWQVVLTCLTNERATLAGGLWTLGIDDFLKLARGIEIDGQPALRDRSTIHRIADIHARLRGVERTGLRAVTALSKGLPVGPEASISKLVLGRAGQEIASLAVDLMGQAGLARNDAHDFQHALLHSPALRLAGGTDEILRNIIAERVLGMPR
jgi:acyl-CoA dehydrogenase